MEKCVQEEGRIEKREENINEDEDQALAAHTNNGRNKRKDQGSPISRSQDSKRGKKFNKDYSSYESYKCHNLGHISRHCPLNKKNSRRRTESSMPMKPKNQMNRRPEKMNTLMNNMS